MYGGAPKNKGLRTTELEKAPETRAGEVHQAGYSEKEAQLRSKKTGNTQVNSSQVTLLSISSICTRHTE